MQKGLITLKKRIVAIYARVSTEHEAQLSALENQIQYYENLFSFHPEWELYEKYIDEGITGTSVKKRKSFLKMMEDAAEGKFDLIVTREVSRFARNTVDTLQQTRILKQLGVEVYFTEDNIWTMNDDDGELRLTIMATLAQNESKKTSTRVKAGQMVSFQNAVPYGNGNVLGYDRVGKEFVINEEQAKTVRMVFDLYLAGHGLRYIQYALESAGRKTSTGKSNWFASYLSRLLRNPFYCGTIVYRKEYVPDYLEQKKVKNYGEVEQIVVEGTHEKIVTKEEFARVQQMIDSKSMSRQNRGRRGKHTSNDVWCKKLKCHCGHSFNRRVWKKTENGLQYAYQCYSSIHTGTIETRKKKGLSLEGICDSPMIPAWKLGVMADVAFRFFWQGKGNAIQIANDLLEGSLKKKIRDFSKEISDTKCQIEKIERKYDNLIDMRMGNEISKEVFENKKKQLISEKERYEKLLEGYEIDNQLTEQEVDNKLLVLKHGLEKDFDFSDHSIPEEIIDAFVKEIVVYKDCFVWKFNFLDDLSFSVEGRKENYILSEVERPTDVNSGTGSDQQCRKIDSKYVHLTTLIITRDDVREYMKYHPEYKKANRFSEIVCKIYI